MFREDHMISVHYYRIINRGVTQSLRQGGGHNMFVRMDLSLKYSQKRNFFEQKKKNFQKQGG